MGKPGEKLQLHRPIISKRLNLIMKILAGFVIFILSASFFRALLKVDSFPAIGTDQFVAVYCGSFLMGHLLVFGILLLIYFTGTAGKKDFIAWIMALALLVLLLLQQVKTWIYIPLLAGLILRFFMMKKIRIRPSVLLISVLAVIALYFLSYYFAFGVNRGNFFFKNYKIAKHMVEYLYAGVLGFAEHIRVHQPIGKIPHYLVMPYVNIWNFLHGESVQGVVSPYHVLIDYRGRADVNVKSFLGTIFVMGGYLWGTLYVISCGIIIYLSWAWAILYRNEFFRLLYAFLAAPLVLGWFDFYYNHLTYLEIPLTILVMMIFTRFINRYESPARIQY